MGVLPEGRLYRYSQTFGLFRGHAFLHPGPPGHSKGLGRERAFAALSFSFPQVLDQSLQFGQGLLAGDLSLFKGAADGFGPLSNGDEVGLFPALVFPPGGTAPATG